jgi:hypothetical protein
MTGWEGEASGEDAVEDAVQEGELCMGWSLRSRFCKVVGRRWSFCDTERTSVVLTAVLVTSPASRESRLTKRRHIEIDGLRSTSAIVPSARIWYRSGGGNGFAGSVRNAFLGGEVKMHQRQPQRCTRFYLKRERDKGGQDTCCARGA